MPEPTLALVVFPSLWATASARHPDPADWPAKFRTLCAFARDYWLAADVRILCASQGEKNLLFCLGHLGGDLEPFILQCAAKYPHDPLGWLDPADPCVPKPAHIEVGDCDDHRP
jgi:hypothetical protein